MQRRTSGEFLYLTTTGRVSGLPREIEIWYLEANSRYYLLSEGGRKANWVRNIEKNARVKVSVGKRAFAGTARVVDEKRDAKTYALAHRLGKQKYDWDSGLPVEIIPDTSPPG
ncbi:MAG: nitroreductase family deazaflavin-dependent oxidoreductase, partial [Chloroflexi bacterium]|nr:nitroreductase family deazaflavin-dependent oxidoreductase [Chloroflexota bacterium]